MPRHRNDACPPGHDHVYRPTHDDGASPQPSAGRAHQRLRARPLRL